MPLFLAPPPIPASIGTIEEWPTGTITVVLAANSVTMMSFELPVATTFSGAQWYMGATAAGTTDVALYSFDGNTKWASTGATANSANTLQSVAFSGGNITVQAGRYFVALCPSSGSDTYAGKGPTSSKLFFASRLRLATNAGSGGVTPATTGGYGQVTGNAPAFALTVVNGL